MEERTNGRIRTHIYIVYVWHMWHEKPTHILVGVVIHVLRFGRRLLGTTFSPLTDSRRDAEERRMDEFSGLKDACEERPRSHKEIMRAIKYFQGCVWIRDAEESFYFAVNSRFFFRMSSSPAIWHTPLSWAKCFKVCNHYCDILLKLKYLNYMLTAPEKFWHTLVIYCGNSFPTWDLKVFVTMYKHRSYIQGYSNRLLVCLLNKKLIVSFLFTFIPIWNRFLNK